MDLRHREPLVSGVTKRRLWHEVVIDDGRLNHDRLVPEDLEPPHSFNLAVIEAHVAIVIRIKSAVGEDLTPVGTGVASTTTIELTVDDKHKPDAVVRLQLVDHHATRLGAGVGILGQSRDELQGTAHVNGLHKNAVTYAFARIGTTHDVAERATVGALERRTTRTRGCYRGLVAIGPGAIGSPVEGEVEILLLDFLSAQRHLVLV